MGSSQVSSVAIVLVNWNGYPFTAACLRSLEKIHYPDFFVVLVDNGSTDDSLEKLKSEFPEVHYISIPTNQGFTGGNNAGIQHALDQDFDYVLLLNNDTVVKPDFLDLLVEFQKAHPQAGMVQPLILFLQHKETIWSAGGRLNPFLASATVFGDRKSLRDYTPIDREIDWATGCCTLLPSSVIRETGLLEASYFAYFEDVDWSLRIKKKGLKIFLASQSVIFHEASASSKKQHDEGMLSSTVFYLHSRNQLFQLRRHLKFPFRLLAWPYHILKYTGWMAYFCIRGRFKKCRAVAKGIRDGICLNPDHKTPLCP